MKATADCEIVPKSEPGIYPGISRAEYERIEAVNWSILKHYARSPAHAREQMIHPKAPTDAMETGTALHCAVLEPERFERDYATPPKVDRRTTPGKKAWADFEAANVGKEYLEAKEWDKCLGMRDGLLTNGIVREILTSRGKNEVGVVWKDEKTGLMCKALIDRISTFGGWTVVVDFKSTANAQAFLFASQIVRLGYHGQAAHYLEGLSMPAAAERRWLWAAVESERPHLPIVYEPSEDMFALGRMIWRDALDMHAECVRNNKWPGYPEEIHSLNPPRWAMKGWEE